MNVREFDRTENNCLSWKWLEDKDVVGDFMSEYIRKSQVVQ